MDVVRSVGAAVIYFGFTSSPVLCVNDYLMLALFTLGEPSVH